MQYQQDDVRAVQTQHMMDSRQGVHNDSLSKLSFIYQQLQVVRQTIQQNNIERRQAHDAYTQGKSLYFNPK